MELTLSARPVSAARGEDALVDAAREGDDRAFEQLYARYRERIHAFILSRVRDHGRAEDIGQEVFMSALRQLRACDQPIAFKPWLYTIARNACIDEFRRGTRGRELPVESGDGLGGAERALVAAAPTPSSAIESKQSLVDLRDAFGGLSDSQHRLLVLREFEGRSYDEIGARLGMTRQMVESGLHRARRKLGEEYTELASGQRCAQIQTAIDAGGLSSVRRMGIKDRRRCARHLAHCQPCRHRAMLAGVDEALLRPRSIADKVAALLPFGLLRWPFGHGAGAGGAPGTGAAGGAGGVGGAAGGAGGVGGAAGGAGGVGGAAGGAGGAGGAAVAGAAGAGGAGIGLGQAAAVAALALAGAGGGLVVATQHGTARHPASPRHVLHRAASPDVGSGAGVVVTRSSAGVPGTAAQGTRVRHHARRARAVHPGASRAGSPASASGAPASAHAPSTSAPATSLPRGRRLRTHATAPPSSAPPTTRRPARGGGTSPGGGAPTPPSGSPRSTSGSLTRPTTGALPGALQHTTTTAGSAVPPIVQGIGSTVNGVGQGVGGVVNGVGQAVGGTVDKVTQGTVNGVGGTVNKVTQGVGGTVNGVGQAVGGTVNGVAGAVGSTVGGLAGSGGGSSAGASSTSPTPPSKTVGTVAGVVVGGLLGH